MPYCDNFWYKDAHKNMPSRELKTENQLIRFDAASDWNVVWLCIQQNLSVDQASLL